MQGIADPYLNVRNRRPVPTTVSLREIEARSLLQMPLASKGYPSLEGRSDMQDEWDDNEERSNFTDRDLMPDTPIPLNPAVRAFQESGHGVQVFRPKDEDED